MRHLSWLLCGAALSSPVWSQALSVHSQGPRPIKSRTESSSAATKPAHPLPDGMRLGVDRGSGTAMPAVLDDSIPLPIPARYRATPNGDVMTAPASGDPYFLGFASGNYSPPAGERIDPELLAQVRTTYTDGRPAPTVYAFVMLEKRVTDARIAEIEGLGAKVIGFHPNYALKVAMSPSALESIASLDFVHWVGVPKRWQKVHPTLAKSLSAANPSAMLDVYVDVYDSDMNSSSEITPVDAPLIVDNGVVTKAVQPPGVVGLASRIVSNGWQQRALEKVGVEVLEYVDSVRAFKARVAPAAMQQLTDLDFVQFVEPVPTPTLNHDESTPMVNSDIARYYYNGGVSQTVVTGQLDSGNDVYHTDMTFDEFGWDYSGSATGPFHDGCTHGTHVAGTLFGRGVTTAKYTGNAPGAASQPWMRHFNVKIFDDSCGYGGSAMSSIMAPSGSSWSDGTYTTAVPHLVTNSWGSCCGAWLGSEESARLIDDRVYSYGQLWIWAAGNNGTTSSINLEASAKNSFTVGSVNDYVSGAGDPGVLSGFSSQGPTGDGRWKPSVCAPGDSITSIAANTGNGYSTKSGTSMATPHVAGVAADLLDAGTWLQGSAERTESLLMATATTKSNAVLTSPTDTHLRQYGTGRVDDYKAVFGGSTAWSNWGFWDDSSTWYYSDFTVNAGATRLIVCMNYSEPSCSAGASKALVNNFDLYLDQDPIDPNGNTGDWFVQQSSLDNTEIRILDNPQVGAWRWKVWPTSVPSNAYFGVTVAVVYGNTLATPTVTTSASSSIVKPGQATTITAQVSNSDALASATYLDTTSSAFIASSWKYLGDGKFADMSSKADMELGDIPTGYARDAYYSVEWFSDGIYPFTAQARGDNFTSYPSSTTFVTVDGTPPPLPTGLHSSTHTANVWSNNSSITFNWTSAGDNLSGLAGYDGATATSASDPGTTLNLGAVATSSSTTLSTSANGYYFNLKPEDLAGNWNASFVSTGPYLIDTIAPTNPSSLASTNHTINVPSCNASITITWNAGSDAHSGVKGYVSAWDHSPSTNLTGSATNLAATATSQSATLASSSQPYYYHLLIEDKALNYGTTQHLGPFFIDTNPVTVTSCPPKVNSMGCSPVISSTGAPSASATSGFVVRASSVLTNKNGILFYGVNGGASTPFEGGTLCVAAPVKRTPAVNSGAGSGCAGILSIDFAAFAHGSLGGNPLPALTVPGTIVNMQWWSRDPGFSAPDNTSLSGSLRVTICE